MAFRSLAVQFLLASFSFAVMAEEQPRENKIPDDARIVLEMADKFVLYRLKPEKAKADEAALYDWPIVSKASVKSAAVRRELVSELDKLIAKGGGSRCFRPRHAINATHDGKEVNLVLCFECGIIYVFIDDATQAISLKMGGTDFGEPTTVESIFDTVLTNKVP